MTWNGLPDICPNDDSCPYWWDGYCEGTDGKCIRKESEQKKEEEEQ